MKPCFASLFCYLQYFASYNSTLFFSIRQKDNLCSIYGSKLCSLLVFSRGEKGKYFLESVVPTILMVFFLSKWQGLFVEFLWAPKRDTETNSRPEPLPVWLRFCNASFRQLSHTGFEIRSKSQVWVALGLAKTIPQESFEIHVEVL